jgi:hypothetical protein
MKKKVIETFK